MDGDEDEDFERANNKDGGDELADFVFEEIPDSSTGGIQPGGRRINVMTSKDLNKPLNNAAGEAEALEKLSQF